MEIKEYGDSRQPVVVLIQNNEREEYSGPEFTGQLQSLERKYRVVIPVFSEKHDIPFQQTAGDIAAYLEHHCRGGVFALCSRSGSWRMLSHILENSGVHTAKAIVEDDSSTPGELIVPMLEA